ncbi:MAG: type II toxin-antitoxin system RelE/ParE family toxin [Polyangia bacterium]
MKETGGIRKVRVVIGGRGTSGGVRVVYYYHSDIMPVFLLTLFAKNEKDNLSKSERNILAALAGELARPFKRQKHGQEGISSNSRGTGRCDRLHARREGAWAGPQG